MMKKLIAIALVLVMACGMFAACGKAETKNDSKIEITADAVTVLTNIWAKIPEDQKFSVYGGDGNNMVDGAPGDYTDMEALTAQLVVPEDQKDNITEIASLFHGMMVNNFTCGVFKMAESADAAAFAQTMNDAVKNNQWMCGFPEELLIATVDGGAYVLVAFGLSDVMGMMKTAITAAYPEAEINFTGNVM